MVNRVKAWASQVRNWANENEGLLALITLVIALIGALASGIVSAVSHSLDTVPAIVSFFQRYGEVAIWAGLVLLGLAFALVDPPPIWWTWS
jgi:energy-converting hydrogenase Eha subunit H